jgi:hypothetical protein
VAIGIRIANICHVALAGIVQIEFQFRIEKAGLTQLKERGVDV